MVLNPKVFLWVNQGVRAHCARDNHVPSMTGTVGVVNFDRSVGGEFTKDGLANNGAPTPTRSGHDGLLIGDRP